MSSQGRSRRHPLVGVTLIIRHQRARLPQEPGKISSHLLLGVSRTAKKKDSDSATIPSISPQGTAPWLTISRARACRLHHHLPSLGRSLLRHLSLPAHSALQESLGGAFHQLLKESLPLSEAARSCCSVTAAVTQKLCPAFVSEHRSTCQPVPASSAGPLGHPARGRDQALAPSRGRNKAPGSPQGASLRGADVQRRCEDEASGREGKEQRGPGSPKPTELRLEAAVTLGPSTVRTWGESSPEAIPVLPSQGASLGPRAAPGQPRRRSGAAAGTRTPSRCPPQRAQPSPALLCFVLPCLVTHCPAFPRLPGTCGPGGAPLAAPSGAAPALDTGGRP